MFQGLSYGVRRLLKPCAGALSELIPLVFVFAILLWAPVGVTAQSNVQAGSASLESLNAKVGTIFASYDKPGSPGCAVGVIKDGKLIYTRGYGMANLEHNIPNSAQIVYDIDSVSKQFTAASILLLAARGKLSLDDDARKYIAELPAYQKPITIRQMLHHTSGLRDYLGLFGLAQPNDIGAEDAMLKMIARQKALNFTPGDEWLYSNSGYFLSSIIVKRVSGKTLAEFAGENIFDPLGMKSTLILENRKRIVPRRATGYWAEGGIFQIEMATMSDSAPTGDGAVQTSLEDLLRWDQNFYRPKVGGQSLIDQLQTVGVLNNGHKLDYALGLYVDEYKGLRRVWHSGGSSGYRSNLTRFPDQKLSVACLCNLGSVNTTQLALRVADLYLADQFKAAPTQPAPTAPDAAPIAVTEEDLKNKIGLYHNPKNGQLRRFTLRDGKLRVDSFTPDSFQLVPLGPNHFRHSASGNVFTFERRPDGKLQLQIQAVRQGRTTIFEPVIAATPNESGLAEYVGSYFSEELDTSYHLRVEKGELHFFMNDGRGRPMQPTFRDGFFFSGAWFEFKRDAQGKVSGFMLGAGPMRNLIFARQSK